MLINKDTDYAYVIKTFPIHWSLWRETGLKKLIEQCKVTGNEYELTLDEEVVYKLRKIERKNNENRI